MLRRPRSGGWRARRAARRRSRLVRSLALGLCWGLLALCGGGVLAVWAVAYGQLLAGGLL